jgi:hypothetical protein
MSYHPGIDTPKFCTRERNQQTVKKTYILESYHTTEIGMLGAFGKTNLTSSNFPLRRQFSAKPTLQQTEPYQFAIKQGPTVRRCQSSPSSAAVVVVSLESLSQRRTSVAHLSPRPWAMMTVAVCFLAAGTISAGPAILCNATILLALMGLLICLHLSAGCGECAVRPPFTSYHRISRVCRT